MRAGGNQVGTSSHKKVASPTQAAPATKLAPAVRDLPTDPRSTIDRLSPSEAQIVLRRIIAAHADLRVEAERIARELVAGSSFQSVAREVEGALGGLDLDDLEGRAGRRRDGYTSPTDAAWELLGERLEPFIANMERQLEVGLSTEALETCKGILLGLYRLRESSGDEFLGWAEDFPPEAAGDALTRWVEGICGKKGRRVGRSTRPALPPDFVAQHIPEWSRLVEQVLKGA